MKTLGILPVVLSWLWLVHPIAMGQDQDQEPKSVTLDSLRLELGIQRQKLAEPVNELNELYETQLKKLESAVKQEGDLDKLVRVQSELESLTSSGVEGVEDFPRLSKLQGIYLGELAKRNLSESGQLKKLLSSYLTKLKALEKQHTQAGQVEEALKVREESDRIEAELSVAVSNEAPTTNFSPARNQNHQRESSWALESEATLIRSKLGPRAGTTILSP